MPSLILQSVLFLVAAFGFFAVIGWLLAGNRRKARPARQVVDWSTAEVVELPVREAAPMPAAIRPQPVSYLDAAAEHFASGLVIPSKATVKEGPAYMPLNPAPRTDVAALSAHSAYLHQIDDFGGVRRVSSLAGMTPESVEAAVQQAGSGLEPVRLTAAQGPIDDLTVISGITADQQKQLNDLGIYHFWQIAGWSPEHVAWVASRLPTSRRIARENWMSQAARLARLS